jgi:hypothetical protein
MFIPDPGSRIPDPKTATTEKGEKITCPTFFCSHKYHKLKIILFLSRKKCRPIFKKMIELFTPKNVMKGAQV